MTRRISSSRPITGSSLPCAAASVRSRPYFSSAWNLSSGFWSVTRCEPRTSASALSSSSRVAPARAQRVAGAARDARPGPAAGARSRRTRRSSSRISVSAARRICDELARPAGRLSRRRPCVSFGSASSAGRRRLADRAGLDAELAQHRDDDATLLLEQDGEQMLGRRLRVAALVGQPLRGLQRLLGLDGETVWLHISVSVFSLSKVLRVQKS